MLTTDINLFMEMRNECSLTTYDQNQIQSLLCIVLNERSCMMSPLITAYYCIKVSLVSERYSNDLTDN